MYHKMFLRSVVITLLLTLGGGVSAHGSAFSYEEVKDGYTIDIGHDEFIAAYESMRFDFALYPEDIESIEGEIFTDIWVTITKDKHIYFAGGIDKPVFGTTGFTYTFPEEGEYVFSARYQKDGETVVATEFPLAILPPLEQDTSLPPYVFYGLVGIAGVLIGTGIGFFIPRKKNIQS